MRTSWIPCVSTQTRRALMAAVIALACVPALAITFTNNTNISIDDTNYDGTAIVVSNCTLTVGGPHTFASVEVAAGGVLTHWYAPDGTVVAMNFITNEAQVLSSTNPVTLLNSNVVANTVVVTDTTGATNYTNGVDYLLLSTNNNLTALERTAASSIPDGATVLVSYGFELTAPAGLTLTVSNNVEVDVGGAINANGIGYPGGTGTGAGRSSGGSYQDGSGGGYGGIGGMSSSNAVGGVTYGSFTGPTNLGSGGGASYAGAGGSGGGLIQITAGGSVIVNGTISANGANGTNARSGGGSGGSIWLTGLTLSGSGAISANGGSGDPSHGGGGGGGRIALQCGSTSFTGPTTAYGGAGANIGGAGTVYTQLMGQHGVLVIDNGGQSGGNTSIAINNSTYNVFIQGGASVFPSDAWTIGNLTIASNGFVLASSLTTLNIAVAGAITIEAGGAMLANIAGYYYGNPGQGTGGTYNEAGLYPCGGGGYGGNGAAGIPTNAAGGVGGYGSQSEPGSFGSAGGTYQLYSIGGNGGGAIQITSLSGIVQVDGTMAANGGEGESGGGGGGSGGSIWLTGGTLLGSGSITANGGNGANSIGGGGGGGRIVLAPTANLFAGTISAYGGGGGHWGGAGTVLIQTAGTNQLILDNGGNAGTNTLVQTASATDLIVRGGAIGSSLSSVSFANLYLNSNGWLAPYFNSSTPADNLTFTFSGSATIQAGGGIVANSAGYAAGAGLGEGHTYEPIIDEATNYCSGAGHGGYGGNSFGNYAAGGTTYDSMTSPSDPGSGGGMYSGSSLGGAGGGVVWLVVRGTLEIDGIISANGGNGSGFGGGGGSGGSIWLVVGALSGAGSIAANGGSGVDGLGGGGGGGMIYIPCTNNSFSGTVTAYGGSGANRGGAGTAIIQVSGRNSQLILDNGGLSGPATPLTSSSTTDLTLRNGAVGLSGTSLTLGNVLISSNSWLLVSNSSGMTFSSATIQAGGGIIADSFGYVAGQGSGAGHYYASLTYPCSGAGHGGNGGSSITNAAVGGIAYDSQTSPDLLGSGGGTFTTYSLGGRGGGAFRLTVTGLLQVDGTISANGGNGSGFGGGGGSGGSIWLTPGTLAGAGSITANGGSGAGTIGGGGAGGCIALYPTTDLFTGVIAAYGGGGANWGGAGTLYIQISGQSGQLILNNGGQSGAGTPIQSISSSTAIILSNGAVGYQQSLPQTFASLLVSSNAWLKANPISGNNYPGLVSLTVTGNAMVEVGGGIVTDNSGYAAGSGNGAGHPNNNGQCGGAGYGGYGASIPVTSGTSGAVYGSITSPTLNGSGGGYYNSTPASIGGAGGGSIRLTVNGTLEADGTISANGGNGSGFAGGGGSGGSVLLTVGTLAGVGSISANGGSGADGSGGGGGGGRIVIGYTADDFVGPTTAYGGGGYAYGGAGTIYTKANSQSVGQLLLVNGGETGTNTPLSSALGLPSQLFNLTIGSGASVSPQPQTKFPQLNNLTIASGGLLTVSSTQSTLDLLVFNNVDVESGGAIAVDGEGYIQGTGPGAGQSVDADGSGAGYGGTGGASASGPGGASYGSTTQPVDYGSGGGFGGGPVYGGSQGGGALRLSVGGILTVDGRITANGEPGLQDDSGGGSGGSVWVTAAALTGGGQFAADGGAGELYGGGGGAGGRIALYSGENAFFGLTAASGGEGDSTGGQGSIYLNSIPPLQVISNSPVGIVSNGVTSVTLWFNDAPNPNSFPATAISLATPNGPLPSGSFSISMVSSANYVVSFPLQTAVGNYVLTVGPNINDLYGNPMSQAFTGTFTIWLPVIQGAIVDTNGQPVTGVLLQPSAGLSTTTTDTNGNYALGFVPGSSFTVTPSLGTLAFVPSSMSYTNVSASISNQNYLMVPTAAPVLTAAGNATNLVLNWQGIPGVSYQVYSSTDLINWQPVGAAVPGVNGPVQIAIPPTNSSPEFFCVQSSY
ncbi:MAG: beta strand repeat-containing protein [Limisphaerales bacterium]